MKQKKILLVDDEIETAQVITNCFDEIKSDYIFFRATNGIDALKIAKLKLPDIILTDWDMPKMSGIELIKNLKTEETTKTIPVIMITGVMTSSENLRTSFEAGAIDFIRKPIDKNELIARIRSMLLLADYYNQIVELKNRELTHTALNIIHNNEFNMELRKEIMEIDIEFGTKNKQLSIKLNELKSKVSNKVKNEAWQQFDSYYQQSNPEFFKNLTAQFNDLSPAEIKICAFLRLNLNTKDIASILCLSIDTIKTLRYRLRKKLNLNTDENLYNFLINI